MQNRQTFRLIENISSMTGNHFWKEGGQSFREKVLWLYVVELKDYDYFVWKLFLILFSSVFFFCCRVLAISGYYNNTRFDLTQDRSRTQEWRNNKKGWNSTVKLNLISRCCWKNIYLFLPYCYSNVRVVSCWYCGLCDWNVVRHSQFTVFWLENKC